ncbi:hypothetical protein GCM10010276_48870 [Streptomyces longisporus]|uniref:Uncharacterized protein n=1 Tax=Streptomyces longisporus TaxID=1948 RepID=A0ABN3MEY8_STRLO
MVRRSAYSICGTGETVPAVLLLPAGKALTVRTVAGAFLDSLGNPNTVRNYGIAVGKTVERIGERRPHRRSRRAVPGKESEPKRVPSWREAQACVLRAVLRREVAVSRIASLGGAPVGGELSAVVGVLRDQRRRLGGLAGADHRVLDGGAGAG